jgi:hypothetical protein
MKGLIVKSPWIDKILSGEKSWEIRGSNTKVRGTVCLIKSGTGKIYGTVDIIDSHPVSKLDLVFNRDKHCITDLLTVEYEKPNAWIMKNPVKFDNPISYRHPQGAVIWVNLLPIDVSTCQLLVE